MARLVDDGARPAPRTPSARASSVGRPLVSRAFVRASDGSLARRRGRAAAGARGRLALRPSRAPRGSPPAPSCVSPCRPPRWGTGGPPPWRRSRRGTRGRTRRGRDGVRASGTAEMSSCSHSTRVVLRQGLRRARRRRAVGCGRARGAAAEAAREAAAGRGRGVEGGGWRGGRRAASANDTRRRGRARAGGDNPRGRASTASARGAATARAGGLERTFAPRRSRRWAAEDLRAVHGGPVARAVSATGVSESAKGAPGARSTRAREAVAQQPASAAPVSGLSDFGDRVRDATWPPPPPPRDARSHPGAPTPAPPRATPTLRPRPLSALAPASRR